ncbi:hypothetical protein Tco_1273917 [Tanacetum coccineum]
MPVRMQSPYRNLSRIEGLDKTYDRFQKLISQLEIHGEVISQEDANLKLLRSLPSAWNNIALIMRNKSDLNTLSIDDLYNNLKVYESEIKGQTSSSLNSHNVAFVSSDNSSSTNEKVNIAHSVSATNSKDQASTASYADDVIFSFFANQSNAPQLDNKDLEQINADDLEEMDLKWQVAMLTMRVKRFIKKTGRKLDLNGKETVGFDRTKGNRNRDDPRRNALVDTSTTNALVVQDGIGGYDWSFQAEEGITNFALMAYTSQGSSSSNSKREALNKSNLEIIGYQIGLESLEARIVFHEKNEAVYEENIEFLKYDVQVKDISIKDLKNQLEEALKEKDDLKLKLENFEESSKNLTKLITSQISAKDKTGLGYDGQMNENEVVHIPPPYTRNYMPPRPDLSFAGLDESVFKSAVRKTTTSVPKTETKKPVLNNKGKVTGQREIRPIWNNAQRVNHQNKLTHPHLKRNFVPTIVATKSGQVPVNAAKQSSPRAAALISNVRPVNTVVPKPKVNDALPTTYSYFKAHSLVRRTFNQKSATKTNNFNKKVNTTRINNVTTDGLKAVVSAAKGNRGKVVKSSA